VEPKQANDFWQPSLFALVLILGMFLGYKLSQSGGRYSSIRIANSNKHGLDDLIRLLSSKYVDTLNIEELKESGINGILEQLDPHTVYIPADEIDRVNEELSGSFYGIGVEFYRTFDTPTISFIMPGGPADTSSLKNGDKIIRIDDSLVAGVELEDEDIIQRIRGKRNTSVRLQVLRSNRALQNISIKRGNVPLFSVPAFFTIENSTGYIKIDMFSETTYDEFRAALLDLTSKGIKKLIIDVRDNPGGYMDAVANVADELVSGSYTIVRTIGKGKADSLITETDGLFEKGQVSILVNENSASASEILAGAIQDLDRGWVIGRRTYGKGLVQEQFELPDHSAIRITTARYYLPSGRCIQRSYKDGNESYKHDLIDRFTNGNLYAEDSSKEVKKTYYTRKKRKVYADEGVRPDFFIPLDTTYHKILDTFFIEHGAEEFARQYTLQHPELKTSYPDAEKFQNSFRSDEVFMKQLLAFSLRYGVPSALLSQDKALKQVITAVKSHIAKLLFGRNGRYQMLYQDDPFIRKAISVMQQHSAVSK
jgi:carboxyl-terminal processing protease